MIFTYIFRDGHMKEYNIDFKFFVLMPALAVSVAAWTFYSQKEHFFA